MPRIVGVDVPKEKRIEIALTYIYGIGRASANKILKTANINPDVRAKKHILAKDSLMKLS